jgi:N-acetylglucosaminyldiphosphoundecaprenol N-acetyl-beta-D-mannosaminyltransferase
MAFSRARDLIVSAQVSLAGLTIDRLTEEQVVAHVLDQLQAGSGGWVGTVNIDSYRAARRDAELARLLGEASLLVPDGMPLLWAAWLRGTALVERVTGASLILSLSEAAARRGRSIYLLGGGPGVAERASVALCQSYPGLNVVGSDAPPIGFDATTRGIDAVSEKIVAARPDIVYVGLGFPKQERLITHLAPTLGGSWFVGCGAAIPFAAGVVPRAPRWMQQAGLEWLFRLAGEPRRLCRRYLIDDLPFAVMLLASCAAERLTRRGDGDRLSEVAYGNLEGQSEQLDLISVVRTADPASRVGVDAGPPGGGAV